MAEEEDEGPVEPMAPLWMITYADMITLLFAFFVVLLSMMEMKQPKVEMTMKFFQKQFGVLEGKPVQPLEFQHPVVVTTEQAFVLRRGPKGQHSSVRTLVEDQKTRVTIGGSEMFQPDSAELTAAGKEILKRDVAPGLTGFTNRIDVRGHTSASGYDDGWYLGFQRAFAVMDFLSSECEIDRRRFRVTSCADNEPVDSDQTEKGRERNRRVDVIMTEEQIKSPEQL